MLRLNSLVMHIWFFHSSFASCALLTPCLIVVSHLKKLIVRLIVNSSQFSEMAEKAVILLAENVLGKPPVTAGTYKGLDALAARGQSGFVSTFKDCSDSIMQLTGACYHTPQKLEKELGPMKLAVLEDKSTFSTFGNIESISNLPVSAIFDKIQQKLKEFNVIIVELKSLRDMDEIVGKLVEKIDETNVAVCVLCGYCEGGKIPQFKTPPIADPSWKIIGPDIVDRLGVEKPFLFVSASQKLTRIDHVKAFDEADVTENCAMGVEPICQLFREYSYYTGSSWKYGA